MHTQSDKKAETDRQTEGERENEKRECRLLMKKRNFCTSCNLIESLYVVLKL